MIWNIWSIRTVFCFVFICLIIKIYHLHDAKHLIYLVSYLYLWRYFIINQTICIVFNKIVSHHHPFYLRLVLKWLLYMLIYFLFLSCMAIQVHLLYLPCHKNLLYCKRSIIQQAEGYHFSHEAHCCLFSIL